VNYFDSAQKIASSWPGDKTAPAQLRLLFDQAPSTLAADVSGFVEALYAAATTDADIKLIDDVWDDAPQ
jgi:hypothetical protein